MFMHGSYPHSWAAKLEFPIPPGEKDSPQDCLSKSPVISERFSIVNREKIREPSHPREGQISTNTSLLRTLESDHCFSLAADQGINREVLPGKLRFLSENALPSLSTPRCSKIFSLQFHD